MVQAAGPLVDSITDTQAKICVHEGAMIIHPSIILAKYSWITEQKNHAFS